MGNKDDSAVVEVYAQALLLESERQKVRDAVIQDADLAQKTILCHKQFAVFLEGPHISTQEKHLLIDKIMKGRFQQILINLFHIAVNKNHQGLLGAIVNEFQDKVDNFLGISPATVISAVELSEDERKAVRKELEVLLKRRLHLRFKVNSELMGGVIFRCEDLMIDQSVHGHLYKLKDQLEYKINLKHI